MVSCVQIVNPTVLGKIESFFSDPAYREAIENSANYNTRLCIERRLRMPFLDSQTGVAQNHSNLFMTPRQRIPGLNSGQIYTYPSKRWRKKRRQYLMNFMQPRRKELDPENDMHTISTVENPAACNEDSKDSVGLKDETSKSSSSVAPMQFSVMQDAWYYDEIDMQEMEGFDDPDPDSDYDYEESYTKRKKKPKKVTRNSDSPAAKKPKGPGRGRKKTNYDALTDAEKPFACELCGARYKTRPGLTYHYTHSHKDRDEEDTSSGAGTGGSAAAASVDGGAGGGTSPGGGAGGGKPSLAPPSLPLPHGLGAGGGASGAGSTPSAVADSAVAAAAVAAGGVTRRGGRQGTAVAATLAGGAPGTSGLPPTGASGVGQQGISQSGILDDSAPLSTVAVPSLSSDKKGLAGEVSHGAIPDDKDRAVPSPYCDFCLGDAHENKKTGHPEELVSCSDCGRSGRHQPPPAAPPTPSTGTGTGRRGRGRGRGRRKAIL